MFKSEWLSKGEIAENLSESEQKFRVLFDHISIMAFVIDREHRHIAFNKATERFLGNQIGKTTLELEGIPEETKKRWYDIEERAIQSGQPVWYVEMAYSKTSQMPVYYENWLKPIKDEKGRVSVLLGMSHDVTRLKHQDNLSRKQHEMLEKLVKERTIELEKTNQKLLAKITERLCCQTPIF